MVQRFKFIGITVLSVLILTIVGAGSLSPAYATVPCHLSFSLPSPPTIAQGTSSITIAGTDPCGDPTGTTISFDLYPDACPASGEVISEQTTHTLSGGGFTIVFGNGTFSYRYLVFGASLSSQLPGSYCVYAESLIDPGTNNANNSLIITRAMPRCSH